MKLGISTYTFPWAFNFQGHQRSMDLPKLCHFARKHQIEVVQVGDNCPLVEFDQKELNTLFETGMESLFDFILTVSVDSEKRISRLMVRDNISKKEAEAFIRIVNESGRWKNHLQQLLNRQKNLFNLPSRKI